MAHPIMAPAIIIKKHSTMRNLFAVKDQIPAMVPNITANPKYKENISSSISVLISSDPISSNSYLGGLSIAIIFNA